MRHVLARGLFVLSMLWSAPSALAQQQQPVPPPIITLSPAQFSDRFVQSRPISNPNTIVGFQTAETRPASADPILTVSGIKPGDRTICVHIENVSGSYYGAARLANPRRGAILRLRLPTRALAKLAPGGNEMAIAAQASTRSYCSAQDDYLLAYWGYPSGSRSVDFLLNLGPQTLARVSLAGSSGTRGCEPVSQYLRDRSLTLQRYSHLCRIVPPVQCKERTDFEILMTAGSVRLAGPAGGFRQVCPAAPTRR